MNPDQTARRIAILANAASNDLTSDEIVELGTLEKLHHAFTLLCTGTAPLNPMALGYAWNEILNHSAFPEKPARLRTGGMVEIDGETVTLMEATRRISKVAKRGIALADWTGVTGRLGDIAGLEHPPRAAAIRSEAAPRPAPKSAGMGDLFD